ncbi:MAG: TolC family protein [Victivallales bacterium]|nr:TolC family protein [Victivallales bacterium]
MNVKLILVAALGLGLGLTAAETEPVAPQEDNLQTQLEQLQKIAEQLKVQAEQLKKRQEESARQKSETEKPDAAPAKQEPQNQVSKDEEDNGNSTEESTASLKKVKLTLPEAKKIALADSPTLAQTKARIQSAMTKVRQARAAFYPTVDINGGITRIRDSATTRPNRDFDNTTQYSIGASVGYTLFDGFQRDFNLLQAKYAETSATLNDEWARLTLLRQVANAYYQVLLAQDNMEIAKHDADYNRILLEDARKRKEGGIAKPSDVLNFVLQVQNAEVNYVNAEKTWRVAIVALGALLAIDEDNIWENYELVYPQENTQILPSISEMLAYAREHRPDLRNVDADIQIAREAIKNAENQWYPTVGLFADYGFKRTHSAHFNKHYDRNISYGATANWNVFNGFKTTSAIAQTRADLDVALKERDELLLTIDSEIRQSALAFESNRIQLQRQETVLATATQIRELVHQEYVNGTTTITRLNEVQTDVTNAEAARSAAFIQVLSSMESLRAATGQILELDAN